MRTASETKAYLETTCYGLLRVKYNTWRRNRILDMHASTGRKLNEDLTLDVDGYLIRCKNVFHIDTGSGLWRDPSTDLITTTQTHLDLVCKAVSVATRVWDLADRHNDSASPFKENMVVRWRDRPCFSLKYVKGLTKFNVFLAGTNLVHVEAKGQWSEFHEYVVGHEVQE